MDLAQRILDFIHYLRFEKRYSQHTIIAYKKDLDQFQIFILAQFDLSKVSSITYFHVRSWLASLKDENAFTPRSINRKISSLNSFYIYLLKHQVVAQNPVAQLHALKLPERLPVFLKETETEKLLEEVSFDEGFKGLTDRLICEVLYQTGIRRNELIELKENNVEWRLKQIRVLGKGNKERLIPINEHLLSEFQYYLEEKKKIENVDSGHFFVLESGQPLYAGYVYRTVKRYLTLTTTLKKKSPHVLRHTFATQLLNKGANIQAIKDLLGHSSLAATQIYTHNNIDKLKEIHKLNHPRG